ncbi:MAG: cytochrome c peroxidase [Pseudomonadales bacterium]
MTLRFPALITMVALLLTLAGCGGGGSGAATTPLAAAGAGAGQPVATPPANNPPANNPPVNGGPTLVDPLDDELENLIAAAGITGDAEFNRTLPDISDPLAQLGKKLFFSKSLGGDFDSACVTCHHPVLGGADGLSLPVGTGAADPDVLGPGRTHAATGLPTVPRNTPTAFNAGLWDSGLFWDSRVESFGREPQANGAVSAIRTPDVAFGAADPDAGPNLPAAQARFPVASPEEMRGDTFEAGADNATLRAHLAARIGGYGIGEGELPANTWLAEFQAAFGSGDAETLITVDNIMTAIAAYERSMRFVNNPFFDYANGNRAALTDAQKRGGILFFTSIDNGGGGCSSCHAGDHFTDEQHHTVAFPQFGPGKGDGNEDDFGRERETGDPADRYAWRTPSLLNVAVTAPYGHAGAYNTLGQVLAHYNNPAGTVNNFFDDGAACTLPQFRDRADCADLYPQANANSQAALRKLQRERDDGTALFTNINLNNNERADIVAFLDALTDPCVTDRACLAPWIADPADEGPDGQQLNARDDGGNLL